MRCFVKDGVSFDAVSPAGGTVSGNAYLIGAAIFGVAVTDSIAGDTIPLRRLGQFTGLPKAAGAAWAIGDILYWDNAAFNFTKTSAGNTRVAVAASVQLSADTVGDVLLDGHVG
jgi:predicted RecA/RadA family phage recombinase